MPNSKGTFSVTLTVDNAQKLIDLYGHRIGPGKQFASPALALNDMLSITFLLIDILRKEWPPTTK